MNSTTPGATTPDDRETLGREPVDDTLVGRPIPVVALVVAFAVGLLVVAGTVAAAQVTWWLGLLTAMVLTSTAVVLAAIRSSRS